MDKNYKDRIKKNCYGLLKERENGGEWEKFLDTILIELIGTKIETNNYNAVLSKLTACRYLSYKYYRKTILDCINLIDRIDL